MSAIVIAIAVGVRVAGSPSPQTYYFANDGFYSSSSDTPANTYFDGRITNDPEFTKEVNCIFWGGGESKVGFGSIDLINGDGQLDAWAAYSVRDEPITIKRGTAGQLYGSQMSTIAIGILDRIEFVGEEIVRLHLADKAARLELPVQTAVYSGTVSNTAARARPRPLVFGTALSVPVIQPETTGNGQFDLHDSREFHSLTKVRGQGLTLTLDVPATSPAGQYRRSILSTVNGFERLTSVAGCQVADIKGALKLGAAVIDSSNGGAFTAWTGGVPDGWAEQSTPAANDVTETPADQANFVSNGAATVLINKQDILTLGQLYYCEVEVTAKTSGRLQVRTRFNGGGTVVATLDDVGVYAFIFTPTDFDDLCIRVPAGQTANITIDNVKLYPATLIEYLPDVVEYLAVTKGGLTTADLDTTAINTLGRSGSPSEAAYALNYYCADQRSISGILTEVMDCFGGWWYINHLGLLTVGRLTAPSGTATLELTSIEIKEITKIETDQALGFSTLLRAQRNWYVHQENDLAGAVSLSDRGLLTDEYRVTVEGSSTTDQVYKHTRKSATRARRTFKPGIGLGTLLSSSTDAQNEANRRTTLYTQERRFYKVVVMIDQSAVKDLEPGQTVRIVYPRYGLSTGKYLLVVGIKGRLKSSRVELTLWG